MTKKYRYLSEAEKRAAVGRVASGEAVSTVAGSIGVNRNRLYEWTRKYQRGGAEAVRRVGRPRKHEALTARAWRDGENEARALGRQGGGEERKIGEQELDLDFFRRALRQLEEVRRTTTARGGAASTRSSKR